MRKLVLSLAPATLALVVLMACEDTETGGGPTLNLDSGSPNFDATTGFDASLPDAAPDAPAIPQVGVTATNLAGPLANIRIVFHAADGAVIETKLTGADGKATHIGADAATVSALYGPDYDRHIVTWTAVEVGDNLQLKVETDSEEPSIGEYNVTLGSFADGGADQYYVEGPCGQTSSYGTGAELQLYSSCVRAKNSVLATARQWNAGTTAYAFKKGIDGVTDAGTAAITIDGWKAPVPFNVTIANVPVETYVYDRLYEIADGHGFDFGSGATEDNYANNLFQVPQGFADAHQIAIQRDSGNGGSLALARRIPGTATSAALDLAAMLPAINQVSVDDTNLQRPVLSWQAEGGLAMTDGGILAVHYYVPDGEVTWSFVVPPTATSVTAPAMPPEAASFLPFVSDAGESSELSWPETVFIEADVLPSYALFRQQAGGVFGALTRYLSGYNFPALPLDGTYRATSWGVARLEAKPREGRKPAPTH